MGKSEKTIKIKSETPATNGVAYSSDANGTITFTATGGAGTLCLLSVAGGVPAWGACGGGARLDQNLSPTPANSTTTYDKTSHPQLAPPPHTQSPPLLPTKTTAHI